MRTNAQQTNRYFAALWSAATLVVGMMILVVMLTSELIPDLAFVVIIVLNSVAFGGLGFLHGITLIVAREHDARNTQQNGVVGGQEDYHIG